MNIYQINVVKRTVLLRCSLPPHFSFPYFGGTMVSFSQRPLWVVSILALFAVGLGACASTDGTRSSQGNDDRLVFQELSMSLSGKTSYEVVEEMRPQWLRKRGRSSINNPEEVKVYLEGTAYGSVQSLKDFSAENVDYVEHLSSGEAQFRFGPGNTQGALVVYLRSR